MPIGKSKPNIVRVGHPARLLPSVLTHCLDAKIQKNDGSKIVTDVGKEISEKLQSIASIKNKIERKHIRGTIKGY